MQAAVELDDSKTVTDTCYAIKEDFSKALGMKTGAFDPMSGGDRRLKPGSYYWAKKVQHIEHAQAV